MSQKEPDAPAGMQRFEDEAKEAQQRMSGWAHDQEKQQREELYRTMDAQQLKNWQQRMHQNLANNPDMVREIDQEIKQELQRRAGGMPPGPAPQASPPLTPSSNEGPEAIRKQMKDMEEERKREEEENRKKAGGQIKPGEKKGSNVDRNDDTGVLGQPR